MARKTILTAGHLGFKTGAWRQWFDEGTHTIDFRNRVTRSLLKKGLLAVNDSDHERTGNVIKWVNQGEETDLLIEFHFNAVDNITVSGTECFVQRGATDFEKDVAAQLCEATAKVLGIPNRGVKTPQLSHHQIIGVLDSTKCQSVLFEICFMSNPADVKKYLEHRATLVKVVSNIIFKAAQL